MHENHRLVARVLGIAYNCLGATVIFSTNVTFGVLRAFGLVSLDSTRLYGKLIDKILTMCFPD